MIRNKENLTQSHFSGCYVALLCSRS